MNIFNYDFNGKSYPFKITIAGKIEIEKMQKEAFAKINLTEEEKTLFKQMTQYHNQLTKLEHENKKEEIAKLQEEFNEKAIEYTSLLDKIEFGEGDEGNLKIAYTLLKNTKECKNISKEEYTELIEDMEDKLGVEETLNVLQEIRDKVFMFIESQNKKRKQ